MGWGAGGGEGRELLPGQSVSDRIPRIPRGGRERVFQAPGSPHSGSAAWENSLQAATLEETASCSGMRSCSPSLSA